MARYNPFSFTPIVVTLIITAVYLSIVIPLILVHEIVPSAPSDPNLYNGLNTTEAWLDLTELTNGYHPYNSHRNDEVRNWLLKRIESILGENEVSWLSETRVCIHVSGSHGSDEILIILFSTMQEIHSHHNLT